MGSYKKSIKRKVSNKKLKENSYFILKILLIILVILVLSYYIKNELNIKKKENFQGHDINGTSSVNQIPERKNYTPNELYEQSAEIHLYLDKIKRLQDSEYYNIIDDTIFTNLLNELKDETNQKDIRLKSSVGIYQSLQDEDIKSIKLSLDDIKNEINKNTNNGKNKLKHIPSGAELNILNNISNNKVDKYLQISDYLNTCLEYDKDHNHNKIEELIENGEDINNTKLKHCDFDNKEQKIIISDKIDIALDEEGNTKYDLNENFNKQLHDDCKDYGKLGPHSKLNNYPFYHVHPEPMNDEPNKKYCLDIENGHASFQKCSGKQSQRFQLI